MDYMSMADIGNAERVGLMERLVALEVEHRDLDGVIQRIADHSAHDQLQLTRLKRRKLLLKDQIAWLQRQIDPDVSEQACVDQAMTSGSICRWSRAI